MKHFEKLVTELREWERHSCVVERESPTFGDWPEELHPALRKALNEYGAPRPYLHQSQTVQAALAGEDVVLVTGTASGKTLSFLVPVFDRMLRDRSATALLLYPTKALSGDQFETAKKLRDALGTDGEHIVIDKYDGDTTGHSKKKIRNQGCSLLLTNPDEIHAAFLQHHSIWQNLLSNLRYVILDEVHAYSGYFGSNVGLVLRRLRALCDSYGSSPCFIAASATIGNARIHVESLIGKPVKLVDNDTAGKAPKHFSLIDPKKTGMDAEELTVSLIKSVVDCELRGIVFVNSRSTADKLAAEARKKVGDAVAAYRAGYTKRNRQVLENRLKSGDIRVVVSTSALELGIDIGDLEVCILHGLPKTNNEIWQRLGRIGRKQGNNALGIVVPRKADEDWLRKPDKLFDRNNDPEYVVVNTDNRTLLEKHLACAAYESGGKVINTRYFPEAATEMTADAITKYGEGAKRYRTYMDVDLRCIREQMRLVVEDSKHSIGIMDGIAAHREAHWNAVYLHGEDRYRVVKWTLTGEGKKKKRDIILAYEKNAEAATKPILERSISAIEREQAFELGPTVHNIRLIPGRFEVREETVGYKEKVVSRKGKVSYIDKPLKGKPKGIRLNSRGVCIVLGQDTQARYSGNGKHDVLHSLGHLVVQVLLKERQFNIRDVLEYTTEYSQEEDSAALYIVEAYPHGLGYMAAFCDKPYYYLNQAFDRVRNCACQDGCPNCILLGTCSQNNKPRDKETVQLFLDQLLSEGEVPARPCTTCVPSGPIPLPRRGTVWNEGDDYHGFGIVVEVDNDDGVTIERPSGQPKLLPWQ